MKNKSLIIVAVAFAAVMIIALALYPELSKKAADNEVTTTGISESSTAGIYPRYTDVKIFDANNRKAMLSDFEGKPIIISFWATWCGYCLYEMPDFEAAYKEYGDEIQFLIVNTNDSQKKAAEYIESMGYTFPVYYDLEYYAYEAYGLSSLPRTVAIDKDGNMIYNRAGMITADRLQNIIDSLK